MLDYAKLKKRYRDAEGIRERQKLDAEFRADIEERGAQLARLAPNLKAMEQYEAVKASAEMGVGKLVRCTLSWYVGFAANKAAGSGLSTVLSATFALLGQCLARPVCPAHPVCVCQAQPFWPWLEGHGAVRGRPSGRWRCETGCGRAAWHAPLGLQRQWNAWGTSWGGQAAGWTRHALCLEACYPCESRHKTLTWLGHSAVPQVPP